MNVKQITIAYLKENGFDGLHSEECGCGVDDLMPCDGEGIEHCKPAKAVPCDGSCRNCCSSESEIASGKESCYRPMDTTTKEEETHL
jgi:hypothetical protein